MSKSCIKCSKELGFRDKKWDAKHVAFWCATYWHHEIPVGDKTCEEPSSDMGKKDSICAMCYQDHCLEHLLMAMVDHERETNKGLLRRGKFKKFMETIPLGLSEIAPTWDLDVTGNETNGQLYDMMTEKIQNTERGCPWCKKYFKRLQMVKIELKFHAVPGGLECSNCAEIRSRLTSERLRSLMDEYSELKSRDGSDSQELRNARSALNNARGAKNVSTARNIVGHFMSGYNTDLSRSDLTSYAANEADARYEALSGEAQEIAEYESKRKQDLPGEIEVEQ